jgi:predicted nucleic acid-binding protein
MSLVIDASVFVAGALVEDKFHKIASSFLLEARLAGETIYEPVLVLAEVAGVISRVRKDHTPGDVAHCASRTSQKHVFVSRTARLHGARPVWPRDIA